MLRFGVCRRFFSTSSPINFSKNILKTYDQTLSKAYNPFVFTRAYCSNPCGEVKAESGQGGGASITYKEYVRPPNMSYDERNLKQKRYLSPISVMAPNMMTFTSILQRGTGLVLVFYFFSCALASLLFAKGSNIYIDMFQFFNFGRLMTFLIKFSLMYPFAYHYVSGIKFLLWAKGRYLSTKQEQAEIAMNALKAAAVLTLFFCLF